MTRLLFFLILVFSFSTSYTQTHFAIASADWDVIGTWSTAATGGASCGCIPGAGDDVLIDGYDIDVDAGTGNLTVNSIKITNLQATDVRLRIQGGVTLTVSNILKLSAILLVEMRN